jgi:hypothetical protein
VQTEGRSGKEKEQVPGNEELTVSYEKFTRGNGVEILPTLEKIAIRATV